MKRSSLPAALVALSVAFAAPALATGADPGRAAPAAAEDQVVKEQPNDGELTNFVAAFVRLIGVQHGYMMMMQDEEDPNRLENIKQSAISDMTAAVEQDGLTVDRYNEIALAVRDNPELQGKVETMLQQLASDPSAEEPSPEAEAE